MPTTANVLMISGQSNAQIFNLTSSDLPVSYTATSQVQIYDPNSHTFATMQPGVNTGTPNNPLTWGPEVGEALKWINAHPNGDILYIVKDLNTVHGSTGLAQDPTQLDWSPHSTGEMYDTATADIAAAKQALVGLGLTPHVIGIDWMQGEQDAIDVTKASNYYGNLSELFTDMENNWGDGDGSTPIVYGRINVNDPLAYSSTVRSAQDALSTASPDYREVNTDSFPQQADSLHFNGTGALDLGYAFYDARQTTGTPGDDYIILGSGNDAVNGFKGNDTIQGGPGADTIYGGQGDDYLYGGRDNDVVIGNLGNDWITGDKGNDTLTGGGGADTFHGAAGVDYGNDVITDFNPGDGDRLAFDGATYTINVINSNTVITFDAGGSVTLQGVSTFSPGWVI